MSARHFFCIFRIFKVILGFLCINFLDDAMKYILFRRRPQFGISNDCKINTKAAHNHFYRYSDVRVRGNFFLHYFANQEKKRGSFDIQAKESASVFLKISFPKFIKTSTTISQEDLDFGLVG